MPSKCACGNVNSIYHALDCKLGGYVSMRHDATRDIAAFFLQEAKCKDVRIESALLTVQLSSFSRNTNTQDEACLDVAAVGLYAPFERTFFDIRITHPNCDTNTSKPLDKIYKDHEKKKKDLYEERVLQSEKGSFVPLVFTTSGGNIIVIVIVIALCLQYVLKGYPRKFLELLAGTPPHLTLNQVSYHSAESTEEIA